MNKTPPFKAGQTRYDVDRTRVQQVLSELQPLALEALGVQAGRHVLWDGWLPVHPVMTTPHTNGGWGELMPVWFKPYERPVPFYCLDNWTLFAWLYSEAFGPGADTGHFTIENLTRVIVASNLLIAFLPSTQGAGGFLRQGALTVLLGILWLEPPARDAWLAMHAAGAEALAPHLPDLADKNALDGWLMKVETEAFIVPEQSLVAGEDAALAFLSDETRYRPYLRLIQTLCLSVSVLSEGYGPDWREWIFQAVNVHYRMPDFGLTMLSNWLAHQ